jgi:hypothetical protein
VSILKDSEDGVLQLMDFRTMSILQYSEKKTTFRKINRVPSSGERHILHWVRYSELTPSLTEVIPQFHARTGKVPFSNLLCSSQNKK